MKDILDRYERWRQQRQDRWAAKWVEKRKKGKSYYVIGFAIYFSLMMTAVQIVGRYPFRDPFAIDIITLNLILSFMLGLILGLLNWSTKEKEYFTCHPEAGENYDITGQNL